MNVFRLSSDTGLLLTTTPLLSCKSFGLGRFLCLFTDLINTIYF